MSTISASTTSTTAFKITTDTTGALVFQTGASPTTAMTLDTSQNTTLAGNIRLNNGTADGAQLSLASSGYSDWNIDNYSGNFRWYYNATEYMRLDNAGNLGIGTSSPATPLDVVANSSALNLRLRGRSSDSIGQMEFWNNAASTRYGFISSESTAMTFASVGALPIKFVTNGSQAMTLDASGNLGVGTTSPSYRLHASSATSATVFGLTNTSGTITYNMTGANLYLDSSVSSIYAFRNQAGTESMRIDSSGNLLVGTSVQVTGFNYNKSISVSQDYTAAYGFIVNTTNTSGTSYFIGFGRGGSACGYIATTGTNSTTYATSSDYRLKENISPMTGALAKVAALKPCTYNWKSDGSASQGFIAHELQAVVPDAVVGEKDAVDENGNPVYQGIDTSFLVATLTAAIQELNAKVTALENK